MNATQGTILIMIGALALWLTWSAKSPFAGNATKEQIDAAFKQGQADAADPNSAWNKKVNPPKGDEHQTPDAKDRNKKPVDISTIKTPLICSALGGTWDYATNECTIKR